MQSGRRLHARVKAAHGALWLMMQLDSGERKVPFHFLVLVIMYRALLFASQGDLHFPYVLKQIVALLPWFFPCTTIA